MLLFESVSLGPKNNFVKADRSCMGKDTVLKSKMTQSLTVHEHTYNWIVSRFPEKWSIRMFNTSILYTAYYLYSSLYYFHGLSVSELYIYIGITGY